MVNTDNDNDGKELLGILRLTKDGAIDDNDEDNAIDDNIPDYIGSDLFTIKLHYGRDFDEKGDHYITGKIAFFDMYWRNYLTLGSLQKMLLESGLELGNVSLWFLYPGLPVHGTNLKPLETDDDVIVVGDCIDCYTNKINIYATVSNGISGAIDYDFSFTQYELDMREKRVEEIREECDDVIDSVDRGANVTDEEPIDFFADTSNVDTTETEAARPKKRRKIPPPNPPYRTMRRGRYSMLRGLFVNTEDTPVVLDEDEGDANGQTPPPASQANHLDDGPTIERTNEEGPDAIDRSVKVYEVGDDDNYEPSDVDDDSSESLYDSSEESMAVSSCDEDDPQYPQFNEITDMDDPQFKLGMLFSSGHIFRAAVRKYAIIHQRPLRLKKNLKDKIKWVCSDGCEWKCCGIRQQRSSNMQIKTFLDMHTCTSTWEQKQVNSRWIANAYEDQIRLNPTWKLEAFHSQVINDLRCHVSYSMIYRAMKKAKENILGKHEEEFKKLYAYANELKKVMPTSTVKLMTEPVEEGVQNINKQNHHCHQM